MLVALSAGYAIGGHLADRRADMRGLCSIVLVAAVLSAVIYGEDGAVPVSIVRISVFWAFMLVYALASIAILVQYAGGARDAE